MSADTETDPRVTKRQVNAAFLELNRTDSGNAERLLIIADGSIRFVSEWETWIVWDEVAGHWVRDNTRAQVNEVAKRVGRRILALAAGMPKSDEEETKQRKAMIAFGLQSENKRAIDAMVNLARGLPGIAISHEEIDANPYLLCCKNGTVDLRTGELRAHNRDDLLMTQAPVFYDPTATLPLWNRCLEQWQPNSDIREYLQRICGTGISGLPMEALYISWGTGSNGKSKFFEAIGATLGDFKVVPNKQLLTVTKYEGHPTEIASLFGKRMAVAAETADTDRLNEAQVKNLTGGDRLTARLMRGDWWNFSPTHTLFLSTNYQPDIRGTDEGVWRRVRLIPWAVTIEKKDRDERLLEKLTTETAKSAILNWLIAGFLAYMKIGTADPAVITDATNAYRRDEDVIGSFIADRITAKRGARINNTDLTAALHAYCDDRDDAYPSHIEVNKRMKAAGFKPNKTKVGGQWLNVSLNTESASDQDVGDSGDGYSMSDSKSTAYGSHTEQPSQPSPEPAFGGLLDFLNDPRMKAIYDRARAGINRDEEEEAYEAVQ